MFSLDRAIAEWRRQMVAGGITSTEVLDELESHLRDEIEQQMQSQTSELEAFDAAIRQTGEVALLKPEFENVAETKAARRRRDLWRAGGFGIGLLVACVVLCCCVLFPFGLRANERYATWLGISAPDWRSGASLGFLFRLVMGSGLGFALPVGLLALVKAGLLDWRKLAGFRRHVLVINLLLGAVLTTPEVVTQIMMFVPLQLLFEISVLVAWCWERRNLNRV